MICFNLKDDRMAEIKTLCALSRTPTKDDYRVYGLKTHPDNPLIKLSYHEGTDRLDDLRYMREKLKKFFSALGILMDYEVTEGEYDGYDDGYVVDFKIHIGLRRDLRDYPEVCAAVIKTIVFAIDERIDLDEKIKLPDVPKLGYV